MGAGDTSSDLMLAQESPPIKSPLEPELSLLTSSNEKDKTPDISAVFSAGDGPECACAREALHH